MVRVWELSWYVIVGIVVTCLLGLLLLSVCIVSCFRRRRHRRRTRYHALSDDGYDVAESGVEEEEAAERYMKESLEARLIEDYHEQPELEKQLYLDDALSTSRLSVHSKSDRHLYVDDAGSTSRLSINEGSIGGDSLVGGASLSAYGDIIARPSHERRSSKKDSSMQCFSLTSTHVQISVYASTTKGFVAGKIIMIDDIPAPAQLGPDKVKIHIAVLPRKKYALKTSWYEVVNEQCRIDEHFRYKLSKSSPELDRVLRIRVYGSKRTKGMAARQKCLGQFLMYIEDIELAKGGLTVWERLHRSEDAESVDKHSLKESEAP